MSETDDTDDLLLIPPDFFAVKESDNVINQPFFEIFDSLITHVSNLEDRVGLIEEISDISLLSRNSWDHSFESAGTMQNMSSSFRRFHSSDDLLRSPKGAVTESTQSTPLKPRTKFKLNSVSLTPKTDRYSPKRSQSHGKGDRISQTERYTQSQLFNQGKPTSLSRSTEPVVPGNSAAERDNFISNVKTIKRLGAVRNLENEFTPKDGNLNQTDVDGVGQMLKDMERTQSEIESRIRANEQQIYSKDNEPYVTAKQTWRLGDDINSVPDYNFGIRNLLYNEDLQDSANTNTIKNPANLDSQDHGSFQGERIYKKEFLPNSESNYTKNEKIVSDASSNSTQTTAINRNFYGRDNLDSHALDVINRHKRLLESELEGKVKGKQPQQSQGSNRNFINDDLGLVSLADLWNGNRSNFDSKPMNYKLKLQEEKLRRQHCEELIQQLQNRVLELQQRLAVAIQIDGTKDSAILHFHSAWEIMAQKLKTVANDKQQLEENYSKLKSTHETVMEEAQQVVFQKVTHYENEASKALNLAHGNQEKLSSLEKQCLELQKDTFAAESRVSDLQKLYDEEVEKNKQLAEVIAKKELELNRSKTELTDARNKIAEIDKDVSICRIDLSNMKAEYTALEQAMKDKDTKILELEKQKRKMNEELELYKSTIKSLQDELGKARDQIDKNKSELKHFYQGQVEMVVQNKLKEFQNQLDQAENGFHDELKKRELNIAKTAASHIQQITEKFSVEIKLLEEKHKEEIRLHQIKSTQYQQQIESLERKFTQQQEELENVPRKFHKLMEAQWMEIFRITSNNKSPIIQPDNFSTIDEQLNLLKSRSYTNVEEVLSGIDQDHKAVGLGNRNFKVGEYMSHSDGQESSRQMYKVPDETPVSSRVQHNKQYADNDLQKYIQLLLNRQQPGDSNNIAEMNQLADSAKDRPSWQSSASDAHNRQERQSGEQKSQRDRKGKRPWK